MPRTRSQRKLELGQLVLAPPAEEHDQDSGCNSEPDDLYTISDYELEPDDQDSDSDYEPDDQDSSSDYEPEPDDQDSSSDHYPSDTETTTAEPQQKHESIPSLIGVLHTSTTGNQTWCAAKVNNSSETHYFVSYSGDDANFQGWIAKSSDRLMDSRFVPGAAIGVQMVDLPGSGRRNCTVLETEPKRIKVHYDGLTDRDDEWISKDSDRLGKCEVECVPPISHRERLRALSKRLGDRRLATPPKGKALSTSKPSKPQKPPAPKPPQVPRPPPPPVLGEEVVGQIIRVGFGTPTHSWRTGLITKYDPVTRKHSISFPGWNYVAYNLHQIDFELVEQETSKSTSGSRVVFSETTTTTHWTTDTTTVTKVTKLFS